jgi:hypothetical protein
LNRNGILVATFHGVWAIPIHERWYPLMPEADRWKQIVSRFKRKGFGYAPYPSSRDGSFGISVIKSSRALEIAAGIRGVRVLGYTERGWADNHDVLVLGRTDRLESWDQHPVTDPLGEDRTRFRTVGSKLRRLLQRIGPD